MLPPIRFISVNDSSILIIVTPSSHVEHDFVIRNSHLVRPFTGALDMCYVSAVIFYESKKLKESSR